MAHEQIPAPVAKRIRHENHWHGQVYVDDYFWLRDKESPEVRAYLEAENAYTTQELGHLTPLYDEQTEPPLPVKKSSPLVSRRTLPSPGLPR